MKPPILQLRAKAATGAEIVALLRAIRPLCRKAGALLFANDRPDLALIGGCDGVHVGQDDLAISDVRSVAASLKIGVSTHDLSQLTAALELGPDYVAFGPVFTTSSKQRPDPVVGIAGLASAAERCRARKCRLVAIGGIGADNAAEVARHADMAAVIGALLPAQGDLAEVAERARALHALLGA